MPGVPPSLTRAMSSPSSMRRNSDAALPDSLWLCRLVVGVWMSYAASSFRVCRVSSAAIRSTSPRMRTARYVMSSRLPMGVLTTKSALIFPSLWGSGSRL